MRRLASVCLLGATITGCSQTTGALGSTMEVGGFAFAPPAFSSFCARERQLCSTSGSKRKISLTAERKRTLEQVNRVVNRTIREAPDIATSGRADDWRVPRGRGDCEDFAILKKKLLMERGWPASVLLLTVVRSGGEGHTILTVRTDAGDLVLDNRTSAIRDWSRTRYKYFARQSQADGSRWERIGRALPNDS